MGVVGGASCGARRRAPTAVAKAGPADELTGRQASATRGVHGDDIGRPGMLRGLEIMWRRKEEGKRGGANPLQKRKIKGIEVKERGIEGDMLEHYFYLSIPFMAEK